MKLLQPLELAPGLVLPNRMVMAPLTRNRASQGDVPNELMAEYYRQRASFGLIISEATPVNRAGHGYPSTPGIYTSQQIEGWKAVTDAVHEAGGRIFAQLWHCGRISHPAYQPDGRQPPSASPIAARGADIWKPDWTKVENLIKPRELSSDEIDFTINDFRLATRAARDAGFDGVEIHGANGYLINQFLTNGSNKRSDEYGGSIPNRARFLFELLDAVTTEWPERVGLRLSPSGSFNDIEDSNRDKLFHYVIEKLNEYDLTYLHIVEPRMFEDQDMAIYGEPLSTKTWRSVFKGTLISSGSHSKDSGNVLLNHAQADLIAYGRLAISNPDLPHRFELDAPLTDYNRETFYGGGAEGYTDYPTLAQSDASPAPEPEAEAEPLMEAQAAAPAPASGDSPSEAKQDELPEIPPEGTAEEGEAQPPS
ncbi:MAG: alkene reductase [Verrucomicrobiota bacterium JB023]|nr:alkene reductase [Verrucomicrobiota bacterium JB023]